MNYSLLNTEETIGKITALIREAKKSVVLISPYITLGLEDRIGRAIGEALARGVSVTIIVRRDDQTPIKDAWLEAIQPHLEAGLLVGGVPGLHAKIYLSESTIIVTSLNLLASSFLNTIEIGLWSQDPQFHSQVMKFVRGEVLPHCKDIYRPSTSRRASKRQRPARTNTAQLDVELEGFCIRCCDDIPLNASKPYCRDDYEEWAEWSNENYKDNFCHACGDEHPATMAKPLCRGCYRDQL
ncbi:phospholipase D family protein [Myxococcus faecalis]|uniref:phospholipase D family protein n=1 Tax=Myxococcus faecalis TaxID=3115646 RepID=UPI003CEC7882